MKTDNLQYLKVNVQFMGFGESLFPELEKQLKEGKPDFQLLLENNFRDEKMKATLFFRRSDTSGYYYFNRYEATLQKQGQVDRSRMFFLDGGRGITAKEAYNLLSGRSVYADLKTREGTGYRAWLQLDFTEKEASGQFKLRQYHDNYGFHLSQALEAYPIQELREPEGSARLIRSLEKGNVQMATFLSEGLAHRVHLEANPKFKSLKIYDQTMHTLGPRELSEKFGIKTRTREAVPLKAPAPPTKVSQVALEDTVKKKRILPEGPWMDRTLMHRSRIKRLKGL